MSTDNYVYIQEKAPLLPLNMDEECQRLECQKNKGYKSKFKRQAFISLFFVLCILYQQGCHERFFRRVGEHHQNTANDVNVASYESVQHVTDFDDILAYNENQMNSFSYPSKNYICRDKSSLPYSANYKFEFNPKEIPELSIDQKTNNRHGGSISYAGGQADVFVDENVTEAVVEFDLKFNLEELQDVFWVERVVDTDKGLISLIIRADESYTNHACITIDVTVRVPTAAALEVLTISLANSGITLNKGLTFEELAIAVANGHISFAEGITSGKTGFVVANGHVSGTIDTLSNELHTSIANGHTEIVIKEIDQSANDAIPLKLTVANGHIDLQVPTTFESTFDLKSYVGRRIIESSNPQAIHRAPGGWGATKGYYGDNAHPNNSINLTASSGSLKLNYA